MKTLKEIWEENGKVPIRIVHPNFSLNCRVVLCQVLGNVAAIVSFSLSEQSGGFSVHDDDELCELYQEPKKTAKMWPALCQSNGVFYISDALYKNEDDAANALSYNLLIRLATEYPPILVEVDE
ncbi:MAG: hypothetical protein KAR42_16230 [candidate division Zixibacteria bacterium]|nr:hypothetical protein [candidate division Zixibacteria bacterium]